MLEIKTLVGSKENIKMCEKIRYDAKKVEIEEKYLLETSYANKIYNCEILPFATFMDSNMVAGCYVTDYFASIHIYYLFVQQRYQETGLYLGRNLLNYVLANKQLVERYFDFKTNRTTLCYLDDKSKRIYENLGYRAYNSKSHMMKKS